MQVASSHKAVRLKPGSSHNNSNENSENKNKEVDRWAQVDAHTPDHRLCRSRAKLIIETTTRSQSATAAAERNCNGSRLFACSVGFARSVDESINQSINLGLGNLKANLNNSCSSSSWEKGMMVDLTAVDTAALWPS